MLDVDDDNIWRINLFNILGVTEETPKDELKHVYKNLAKKFHPDRFTHAGPDEQEEAKNKFSAISQAYEILTHEQKRHRYMETRRILAEHVAAELTGQPIPTADERAKNEPDKKAAAQSSGTSEASKEEKPAPKKAPHQENYKRKEAEELYQEAQQYFRKNQLDEAISSFQQAIGIVSDNAVYHSFLGRAYLAKGWNSMAQVAFKQALFLNPNDPIAKKHYEPEKPKKQGFFAKLFGGKSKN